jgi:transposase
MALGIRDVSPRRRDFVAHLQTLRTGDGEPLPPHTEQALRREHERLCLIERQIREIEAAQAAAIKAAAATPARQPEAGGCRATDKTGPLATTGTGPPH